jgi:hypothetical protein
MKLTLAVLMVFTMAKLASAQSPAAFPDTIFVNGDIYTGATAIVTQSGSQSWVSAMENKRVEAMAITDGKIVAVGSNKEILRLRGEKTQIVNFGGNFVMPGFNDAHTHLASGGFEKLDTNLIGTASLAEMKSRIAARSSLAGPGEWVVGRGWDHTLWTDQKLPTRQDLDAVTGGHPAIFTRVDGHIAVANSAALRAVGITAQTPDPAGGKIDREENGEPTGILRETAKDNVLTKLPLPTPEQRRRAIELALQDAAQWGVTSAQDNSEWADFWVYEQLEKEGKLTLRISEWLPFDLPLDELERKRAYHLADDSMLRVTMLKGFMDGSLGSRTAAMLEPFTDDHRNSGLARYEQDALSQKAAERAAKGFQIGFHAIGDRGARMALEAFTAAEQKTGKKDQRLRIEHAQVIAPEDFKKFHDLGVIASMQPNHLLTDMNWAQAHLGAERAKHSYAWKEFLDDGVTLAFGTDYPVEPITPFRGVYAAVTRKNEAGSKEYFPEQKINIHQAIIAYTVGSAFAEFMENKKGTLAPGMLADFIVLDRDITKVKPEEILKTKVLGTFVGGKMVYSSK